MTNTPSHRAAASVIECLESKIAPAGVVNLTLANGVLTISGNGEANQLTFSLTNDYQWSVADGVGSADTQIWVNGVNQGFSAVISAPNSVKGSLGAGDDEITFEVMGISGAFSLSGGDGNDILQVNQAFIGAGLTLDGGNGDDTLTLRETTVVGDVLIKGGAGGDTAGLLTVSAGKNVTFDMGAGGYYAEVGLSSQIAGSVKVLCSSTDLADSAVSIHGAGTWIQGGLSIATTAGHAEIQLGRALDESITIAGQTKITSGNGAMTLTMVGHVQLTGGLNVAAGGGLNKIVSTQLASLRTGAFSYTGGSGNDEITLAGTDISMGTANITLGDGANFFKSTTGGMVSILGDAIFTGGKGNDAIELTPAFLRINGQLKVTTGVGTNHLYVQPLGGGGAGSITYTGSTGDDAFRISGPSVENEFVVFGNVTASMAAGASSQVMVQNVRLLGALTVSSIATTADSFVMDDSRITGAVSLKVNGAANGIVRLDDVALASSILVETGTGNDAVTFDNTVAGSVRTSVFSGAVKVLLGAGDTDYFIAGRSVGGGATLGCIFGGAILIDGGAGVTDSADLITGYGNTFSTVPTVANLPGCEFTS